jgi:hypothetical protein
LKLFPFESGRSQIATTLIAALLALLAGAVIIGVSPTGTGQTITVYPGSSTKIVSTVTVGDGMLINITNSTCVITDPVYTTTVISPMTVEGYDTISPYTSCIQFGLNYGHIGATTTNLTVQGLNPGGFNQSVFHLENEFIRVYFSPADTMRVFINDSANYTQHLRLGWVDKFFLNSSWDNATSAWFSPNTLHINFTSGNQSMLYNVTIEDYSPQVTFNVSMHAPYGELFTHYPAWYPEDYFNYSHPNYVWKQVVKLYDSVRIAGGPTYKADSLPNSSNYGYFELWDPSHTRTNISITPSIWQWTWLANTTDPWNTSNSVFHLFRTSLAWFNDSNRTTEYSFTFTRDQTQHCVGTGTFNLTCDFVPIREGNHTLETYASYYYVNTTDQNNDTEWLNTSTWFIVESSPPPGCDTGPTCDTLCNWLLGHTCDCGEECASNFCSAGICASSPAPPYIPPAPPGDDQIPSITFFPPTEITLYANESHQFRVDVWNNGTATLNDVHTCGREQIVLSNCCCR